MSTRKGPVVPVWNLEDRLIKARKTSGMTQAELAAKLGMSTRTVQRYEDGTYVPSDEQVREWADVCGVMDAWLNGQLV